MLPYKIKRILLNSILKMSMYFSRNKPIFMSVCAALVLAIVVYFSWNPMMNAIERASNEAMQRQHEEALKEARRVAIYDFNNMSRADMMYDFEYMMTALEESWPFFDMSISANGVDVRERADIVRTLLNDSATEIHPFEFLDLLHEHFFRPINSLGHLQPIIDYEQFFDSYDYLLQTRTINRFYAHLYEIHTRPEVLMFYTRMKEDGWEIPSRQRTLVDGPAMEFSLFEEKRVAYMRIKRMMAIDDDVPCLYNPLMLHYESLMYDFQNNLRGFAHLIIDLRGNPGGRTSHFRILIMPHLLREGIQLNAYVFYMDGAYANLSRAVYYNRKKILCDNERVVNEFRYANQAVYFDELLPYLNTEIGLVYAYRINFRINPRLHYFGRLHSAGTRRTTFDIVNFSGEIWLLIDGRTASAAEAATAILKYSGIATVVGEPTFGAMGIAYNPVSVSMTLPNTGILVRFDVAYYTDPYGRPWQGYGIKPHYPNRPGMDALETVLAMIAEMEDENEADKTHDFY
ncbi:MAG: S41 family peptidase [Defluviitaleaceae bacterium]|nr:S41 family peptidase [Defluviitaleaceae bacterium]MCL2239888.1 S41 family peptidase [Defluviitaleaceae bacterium]